MQTSFSLLSGCLLLTFVSAANAQTEVPELPQFVDDIVLPSGLRIDGTAFGGISGLDYDVSSQRFYAISDDRSEHAPARAYQLQLDFSETGFSGVEVLKTMTLKTPEGKAFAEKSIDPESIRLSADGNSFYWSSERDTSGLPAIYQSDLDGKVIATFTLPDAYLPDQADNSRTQGVFNNLAFEGLTLSVDGGELIAMTENGLVQETDKASNTKGSLSRVIVFDTQTQAEKAQYYYLTDAITIQATAEPYYSDNGVSEVLMLPDGTLAVVERAFGMGAGNHIRIYKTSLDSTRTIEPGNADPLPLEKTLWFEIREGSFGGIDIDNIESISTGPMLNGRATLIFASDDNFNPAHQVTQFLLFTY